MERTLFCLSRLKEVTLHCIALHFITLHMNKEMYLMKLADIPTMYLPNPSTYYYYFFGSFFFFFIYYAVIKNNQYWYYYVTGTSKEAEPYTIVYPMEWNGTEHNYYYTMMMTIVMHFNVRSCNTNVHCAFCMIQSIVNKKKI